MPNLRPQPEVHHVPTIVTIEAERATPTESVFGICTNGQ
jgi:hypothetical protein